MTAQIIHFPKAPAPSISFNDWMDARFPGRRWYVVRVRRYGGKFQWDPLRHVLLLSREYRELEDLWRRESRA